MNRNGGIDSIDLLPDVTNPSNNISCDNNADEPEHTIKDKGIAIYSPARFLFQGCYLGGKFI